MMSDVKGIHSRIRAFILEKFPAARKRSFNDDLPLLESGIIDSLGILDVVGFLERTFDISVDDEELVPENFANVECLGEFVERKRGQIEVSAR